MRNILEDLYYDDVQSMISDYERHSEYQKAMSVLRDNEEILTKILDGKERRLFLEFTNAYSEVLGTATAHTFTDAFKLGARVMMEVMNENNI